MDGESKEPRGFKFPRSKHQIAAMEEEKEVGGGGKRKLGFEPTIVGYIYSLHTYRKFRWVQENSPESIFTEEAWDFRWGCRNFWHTIGSSDERFLGGREHFDRSYQRLPTTVGSSDATSEVLMNGLFLAESPLSEMKWNFRHSSEVPICDQKFRHLEKQPKEMIWKWDLKWELDVNCL